MYRCENREFSEGIGNLLPFEEINNMIQATI